MRLPVATSAAVLTLFVSGCAMNIPASHRTQDLIPPEQSNAGLMIPKPPTVLIMGDSDEAALGRHISVNMAGVSLVTLFNAAAPDMTLVPTDPGVDLRKEVAVQIADGTLEDLLRQLTVAANYAFEVDGDKIKLSSSMSQTWNLAAFSQGRKSFGAIGAGQATSAGAEGGTVGASADSSGGTAAVSDGSGSTTGDSSRGITTKLSNNENEWLALINSARAMLGIKPADGSGASDGGSDGFAGSRAATAAGVSASGARLTAIRSLGIIRATGTPRQITQLDQWMSRLVTMSTKQVHLDVKAMKVALNDSRSRGINWQALIDGSINGTGIKGLIGFTGSIGSALTSNPAHFTASFETTDGRYSAILDFLSQYGTVSLISEPNVTVTNGRTANISTGREFSYVATIQQSVVGDSGTVVTTPNIARVLVGVKLAVTPRVLPDDRILINVVPVITNLDGYTEFTIGGTTISNPRIALQSLATQVITRSGVPIHIGGLITSKLQETLNSLPIQDSSMSNPLDFIFGSEQNELHRSELVITITPTLVES